jgi:riboflavin transporter FmnP
MKQFSTSLKVVTFFVILNIYYIISDYIHMKQDEKNANKDFGSAADVAGNWIKIGLNLLWGVPLYIVFIVMYSQAPN